MSVFVTVLAAAATLSAAVLDAMRSPWVRANMTRLGVPESGLAPLGALKAAGGAGLLTGLVFAPVGVAAAGGLILFFLGAVAVTVRARWYAHLPYPAGYLALAVAALVVAL
ncbi:DoxX family protein [Solirubrobacter taibaiensis]|nr:DoxX family protein [Solirubrobacter taibaiensis]